MSRSGEAVCAVQPWFTVGGLLMVLAVLMQAGNHARAQGTRTEPLYPGCNNVVLTHLVGTPLDGVAEAISGEIASIFRWDSRMGRFVGWAPGVPSFAVDYRVVGQRLEAVYICMRTAGQIVQPDLTMTATPGPRGVCDRLDPDCFPPPGQQAVGGQW